MDIQKLNYFISVAQHLNFTKAAQEHHMAQTAMSRQILNLENELGVSLFFRNNRKVELTSAGKELYLEATDLVDRYNKAVVHVRNAAHGYTSSIKIGIGPYERNIIRDFIRDFCMQYPYVEISCEQYDYKTLSDKLTHDALDIIFTIDKYAANMPDFVCVTVDSSPWKLAVSSEHAWAAKKAVHLQDLKNDTVITMNEGSRDEIRRSLNIDVQDYIHANSLDTKLLLVESGLGVAFVPSIIGDNISSRITLLDFDPIFTPRVFLACHLKSSHNPALPLLVTMLQSKV